MADEDVPADIQWRADGTVRLLIKDDWVTLKRPTIGQLLDLSTALFAVQDDFRGALEAVVEWQTEHELANNDPELRKRTLAEYAAHDEACAAWAAKVVAVLGNQVSERDTPDMPSYTANADFGVKLRNHWQKVP